MENNTINQIKTMFNENKTNVILGIVALIVIIVAIVMAVNNKKSEKSTEVVEGCKQGDIFSGTTGKPCFEQVFEACKDGDLYNMNTGEPCGDNKTEVNKDGAMMKADSKGNLSYEAALKQYSGKSLLFNASCVSTPATLESTAGTQVLIANNSNATLELSVQNKKAKLLPYHYMLSFMGTKGEVAVSCNGNTATKITVK